MAVAVETFLGLEQSLSDRLFKSWQKVNAATLGNLSTALEADDFPAAIAAANVITFDGIFEGNKKFTELVGLQAMLFGVAQVRPIDESSFVDTAVPPEVKNAANVLQMSIALSAAENVKRLVLQRLNTLQAEFEEGKVQKADKAFVKAFQAGIVSAGKVQINIGASLHNSRLSQFGFLVETEITGSTTYVINEQLDTRICPVCETMHGQVFTVEEARRKVTDWLSVTDPNDLKTVAPWPRQDRASIERLGKMTSEEVQANGWDTPPYHPLCRGLLQFTSQEFNATQTMTPQGTSPIPRAPQAIPAQPQPVTPPAEFISPPPIDPGVAAVVETGLDALTISEIAAAAAPELVATESTVLGRLATIFGTGEAGT